MSQGSVVYASPRLAKELTKVFGRASSIKVTMRATKDVSNFIRKLDAANKKAAKSSLHFG